jgi:hypothetical protein
MTKLNSLKNTPADGRPQLVDLGMPLFTDPPASIRLGSTTGDPHATNPPDLGRFRSAIQRTFGARRGRGKSRVRAGGASVRPDLG